MADLKTKANDANPMEFLNAVEPMQRREDGLLLNTLFQETTGWKPRMWGSSIVGYGAYDYTYASGRSGRWMATGFSPRKAQLSIYIMPGYQDFGPILDRLGPHSIGKSCLYIRRLDKVDREVLRELVAEGVKRLSEIWPVSAD